MPGSVCCITIALMVILSLLKVRDYDFFWCTHGRTYRVEYIFLELFFVKFSYIVNSIDFFEIICIAYSAQI